MVRHCVSHAVAEGVGGRAKRAIVNVLEQCSGVVGVREAASQFGEARGEVDRVGKRHSASVGASDHVPEQIISIDNRKDGRAAVLRRALRIRLDPAELIIAENFCSRIWGRRALGRSAADGVRESYTVRRRLVKIVRYHGRAVGIVFLGQAIEVVVPHAGTDAAGIHFREQEGAEGVRCGAIGIRIVVIDCRSRFRIGGTGEARQAVIHKAAGIQPALGDSLQIVECIVRVRRQEAGCADILAARSRSRSKADAQSNCGNLADGYQPTEAVDLRNTLDTARPVTFVQNAGGPPGERARDGRRV